MRTSRLVQQWSNFTDRCAPLAVDVSLRNAYAANDRGVRVREELVLKDVHRFHCAMSASLRTSERTDVVRAFL
jgi:hypothetical protein